MTAKSAVSNQPDVYMDDYDDDWTCPECGGEGTILVCCDDICIGQGYCMHGDGYADCPECHGSGETQ